MEINFCDRCDAAIPQADLDTGRARDENGAFTCVHCLGRVRVGGVLKYALIPLALLLAAFAGAVGAVLVLSPRIASLERQMGVVEVELETALEPDPGLADEFKAMRNLNRDQTGRIETLSLTLTERLTEISEAMAREARQNEKIAQEIRALKDHLRKMAEPSPEPAAEPTEEENVDFLLELLADTDPGKRMSALVELRGSKDPRVVAHAIESLADPDRNVRAEAATLLGARKAREGAPKLIERLLDSEVIVRAAAHRALKAISGQDFAYDPTDDEEKRTKAAGAWRDWWVVEGLK